MAFRRFYIGSCNQTAVIIKENDNDKYLVVCFNPTKTEKKRVYVDTFKEARNVLKPTICHFFNQLRELSTHNAMYHKQFIPYLTDEELKMREKEMEYMMKFKCYSLTDYMPVVNVKAINE